MDRGDVVEVDVHEGLESTITVRGHKQKHTEIHVVCDRRDGSPGLETSPGRPTFSVRVALP
jgi:hypothetical protein